MSCISMRCARDICDVRHWPSSPSNHLEICFESNAFLQCDLSIIASTSTLATLNMSIVNCLPMPSMKSLVSFALWPYCCMCLVGPNNKWPITTNSEHYLDQWQIDSLRSCWCSLLLYSVFVAWIVTGQRHQAKVRPTRAVVCARSAALHLTLAFASKLFWPRRPARHRCHLMSLLASILL